MSDMHDLLERRARGFRPADDGLEKLHDHADRRHRRRRVTAGVVAIAVAVAGGFSAYALLDRNTTGRVSSGGFRSIWPQTEEADARVAQARANRGDYRLTWQYDAEEFLFRFGNDGLGWVNRTSSDIAPEQADGNGPITATIRGCPFEDTDQSTDVLYCPDDAFKTAEVTFERLLQHDARGIWFVTSLEVDGSPATVEPSPLPPVDTPQPEDDALPPNIETFVQSFMESRVEGTDHARNQLSSEAQNQYHTGEGGLELYGYTRGADWRITGWDVAPNTDRWYVVVEITGEGGSFPDSGTIHETLTVGSPGDGAPLQVLSAERNE